MTNKYAVLLLLAGSANAAKTQSRATNTDFPRFKNTNAQIAAVTGNTNTGFTDTTDIDSDKYILEAASLVKSAGKTGGLYSLYRLRNTAVITPQGLNLNAPSTTSDDASSEKNIYVATTPATGGKTLYETNSWASTDNEHKWQPKPVAPAATTTGVKTHRDAIAAAGKMLQGAVLTSEYAIGATSTDANRALAACTFYSVGTDDANSALKYGYVEDRLTFQSSTAGTDTAYVTITAGYDAGTEANNDLKIPKVHLDLILGTFYQSNGNATDDSTWCLNGGSDSATRLAFSQVLNKDGTVVDLQGIEGIGPRTKCTFQVTAGADALGAMAPILSLNRTPSIEWMLQVVEWYDVGALGTGRVINATNAPLTGSAIGYDSTTYAEGTEKAVYLNPIEDTSQVVMKQSLDLFATAQWGLNNENDASLNQVGSIGTAIWYDRTVGAGKDTIRSVDSAVIIDHVFAPWAAAVATYDGNVDSYETSRKAYEAGTTTTRPDKPTAMSSYGGYVWDLKADNADTVWTTTLKGASTAADQNKWMLATTNTAGALSYELTRVTTYQPNSYHYLTISDDTVTAANYVDESVSHAFGKLGQGKPVGLTDGKPFIWQTPVSGSYKLPGMNINIFPEQKDSSNANLATSDWAKWTITADAQSVKNYPTIKVKLATAETPTSFAPPASTKTPTAITEPTTTGAAALAASLMAAATVAATMF